VATKYFSGEAKLGNKKVPWESTFPTGMRYGCERCMICCRGRVNLTEPDLSLFKKKGLDKCIVSPEEVNRYGVTAPFIRFKQDGLCSFVGEDQKCRVYANRPMICRSYPIMVSAGLENELIVDIVLRCPYANLSSEPEIKKSDIEESLAISARSIPDQLVKSLEYRGTLAAHIRAAYPPALIEKSHRLRVIDDAISLIGRYIKEGETTGAVKEWSNSVSSASHRIIVRRDNGEVGGEKQDNDILKMALEINEPIEDEFSKERWKTVFSDIFDVFLMRESKLMKLPVKVGWKVRLGNKAYGWNSFRKLEYTKDAIESIEDYMRVIVRRASFQLSAAYVAEYLVDFKKVAIVDYSLNTIILSNAVMPYLDPLSRALAVANGNGEITKEDVRMGISNIDNAVITGLSSRAISSNIINKLDGIFGKGINQDK